MEPASFQIRQFGLSNEYIMWFIAIVVLGIFAYLLYSANKQGMLRVDGKFRPIKYIIIQLRENRSPILATVNKDFVGRYNNSYLGVLWNILFPILLVASIYAIFIGVKNLYPGREYWVYICSGLFILAFCRQALSGSALRTNGTAIRKIPNAPWTFVLADTITKTISCLIPFCILLAFMFCRGDSISLVSLGYVGLMLVILFVFCFGLSMITSLLAVLAGDVRQVVSAIGRLLVWISPIFFYLCDCEDELYNLVMCNPFTYIIEPFHQALSYGNAPDLFLIEVAVLCALFFVVAGFALYLAKKDRIRELV